MVQSLQAILERIGGWPNDYQIGKAGMNAIHRAINHMRGNFEFHKFCYDLMCRHRLLTNDVEFKEVEERCLRLNLIQKPQPPVDRTLNDTRPVKKRSIPGAWGTLPKLPS